MNLIVSEYPAMDFHFTIEVSVTIRMDEKLKKQAEELFSEMGINMTTAFTIFTPLCSKRKFRLRYQLIFFTAQPIRNI
jgi:hypothetical protein